MALADGSVVLGGSTEGDWNTTNKGLKDFAAVKLDIDGVEEWRYQVRLGWTVLVFPACVRRQNNCLADTPRSTLTRATTPR